jgi:hypothetical protein
MNPVSVLINIALVYVIQTGYRKLELFNSGACKVHARCMHALCNEYWRTLTYDRL